MGHEKDERGKHSEQRTGRGIGKSEEGEEKRVEKEDGVGNDGGIWITLEDLKNNLIRIYKNLQNNLKNIL